MALRIPPRMVAVGVVLGVVVAAAYFLTTLSAQHDHVRLRNELLVFGNEQNEANPAQGKKLSFSQKALLDPDPQFNKYKVLLHPDFKEQLPYYAAESSVVRKYAPYPKDRPLKEILDEWPTNQMDIPSITGIRDGSLERLNFQDPEQRRRAEYLRLHEVPFKVYNVPFLNEASERWSDDNYLVKRFGDDPVDVTVAKTNKFFYYSEVAARKAGNYERPTSKEKMPFKKFLETVQEAEGVSLQSKHYYFQMSTIQGPRYQWMYDDLEDWVPQHNFWFVDPQANRGVNCRFGARGISASNHFDGGRNFIAILKGAKRYIIAAPHECPNMHLAPKDHPESRHSLNDWADMDYEKYPNYLKARAINVVLSAGEALYLPGYWFHHIISLGANIQCNTRSGYSLRESLAIRACGF